MGGARRHHRIPSRLSPLGWLLTLAVVVLVILAIVSPSSGVYLGLAAVVLIWAGILGSSFPSAGAMYNHTMYTASTGAEDFGQEAAEKYEHQHGNLD